MIVKGLITEDAVMCCICFKIHSTPFDDLAVDEAGQKWDTCTGQCALDAGIVERGKSDEGGIKTH